MWETCLTVNTLFLQNTWRRKQHNVCSFSQQRVNGGPRCPPPPPPVLVPFPAWNVTWPPLCCPLQCLWISATALWWWVASGDEILGGSRVSEDQEGSRDSVTHTSNRVAFPLPQCQGRLSQEHRLLPLSPGNKTAACPATTPHPRPHQGVSGDPVESQYFLVVKS